MQEHPQLLFKNEAHQNFLYTALKNNHIDLGDTERVAMFYVLGLMKEIRERINQFYDSEARCICPEVIKAPFQTSGTLALTRFAFQLYNNFEEPRPKLLEDTSLYQAVIIDEEDYQYTDKSYTKMLEGEPYYYEYKTASIIEIISALDRAYIPFIFQAISLRFGMSNLEEFKKGFAY